MTMTYMPEYHNFLYFCRLTQPRINVLKGLNSVGIQPLVLMPRSIKLLLIIQYITKP